MVSFVGSEYVLANLITRKQYSAHVKNLKNFNYDPSDTAHRWAYLLIQLVAITWSISLRKFFVTLVIQRNRHPCRSMLNGSTMITHIIHGSLGRIAGSVMHSMYTCGIITCHVLFPRILRDQPMRFELKRNIF